MTTWRQRLESEKPGPAAHFAVRGIGALLLALAAALGWWLHRAVHQPPAHPVSPIEFAAAVLAVASGCLGWALLGEGPGLFRLVAVPGRFFPFSN